MIGTFPSCQAPSKNVTVFDQETGWLIESSFRRIIVVLAQPLSPPAYRNGDRPMINIRARAYVFDAYGTLFDVHAAIGRHRAEAGAEAERFSDIWRTKQLEYTWTLTLAGQYVDFWTLTQRALDYAFERVPSVDRALRAKLLDAYRVLGAFPDARDVLARLKSQGFRTAILSNGTPAMLSAAADASGIANVLDATLSVDALRLYKPRPEVYALVTRQFGVAPDDVVFVSSNRWDVMGAASFGFRPIWVNCARLPDEYADLPATRTVPDLAALPSLTI
jgi:2-haloacid dehalogenase